MNTVIDNCDVIIFHPHDETGKWYIQRDNILVGYIYCERIDFITGEPVWASSNDLIDVYLLEISEFIESSNL